MDQENRNEQRQQQQICLTYQNKKLLHMIELQLLDIQSTLHYIQKKHTLHQLKQALSQIYNIFNQTQPLFKIIKGLFLHKEIKKIMNCFGIIYVILMNHVQRDKKQIVFYRIDGEQLKKENIQQNQEIKKLNVNNNKIKENNKKLNNFGGIHLYNQQYNRHIEIIQHKPKQKVNPIGKQLQPSRQQIKKMISQQLQDVDNLLMNKDEILDIFEFKFKYGRQNNIITFHDQLLSITKFFMQSQNQAFQFLNNTKDQSTIISYNDSFRDIVYDIKKQKEQILIKFTQKIGLIFRSMRQKIQNKLLQINNKMMIIQNMNNKKQIDKISIQTQTIYNIDDDIKMMNKKFQQMQQNNKYILSYKNKQLQQYYMLNIQLQSQMNIKNRQIYYLQMNIKQKQLNILNLNKKIKYLNQSNNKIKDVIRGNNYQNIRLIDIIQNKQQIQKFKQQLQLDNIALQQIKKQKKIAKKAYLDKRRSSIKGQKIFIKRFTQQDNISKSILSKNLSQIAQGQNSQIYQTDHDSIISNKNDNIFQNQIKIKKSNQIISINQSQNIQSNKSIQSYNSYNKSKSKKNIRQKHISQIIQGSKRSSLIKKLNRASEIGQSQILDECSEQDRNSSEEESNIKLDSNQILRVEQKHKKYLSSSKNNVNNKRLSSFNHKHNKSYFSQKQYTQQSVDSLISSQKSRDSMIKINNDNFNKNFLFKNNKNILLNNDNNNIINNNILNQIKNNKELKLCNKQIYLLINLSKVKIQQYIQTQQNYNQNYLSYNNSIDIKNNTNFNYLSKNKDALNINQQQNLEIPTRSATQSKTSKNKHLKTLQNISNKENSKYMLHHSKNINKTQDQSYKNSQSYLQLQEELHFEASKHQKAKKQEPEELQRMKDQRQVRKLMIKSKNLQDFKIKIGQLHKKKCGVNCKHLQKYIQNYMKYRNESRSKIKIPIKNLCENIALTQQQKYLPYLEKKKI